MPKQTGSRTWPADCPLLIPTLAHISFPYAFEAPSQCWYSVSIHKCLFFELLRDGLAQVDCVSQDAPDYQRMGAKHSLFQTGARNPIFGTRMKAPPSCGSAWICVVEQREIFFFLSKDRIFLFLVKYSDFFFPNRPTNRT